MSSSINQLKKTNEENALLASFPMLNPNPIVEVDFNGKILYFNPAAKKFFPNIENYKIASERGEEWKRIVEEFKKSKSSSIRQEKHIQEKWFLEEFFLVPETEKIRIYFTPIDDLKKTQQELEKERNLLQTIIDGAKNCHLVYLDSDFNFVHVNETYAKTCGYTPQEMIGRNHFVLYPHAENEAIFKKARDTAIPIEFKDKPFVFQDQPKRGVTYWDWTLQPVPNGLGKVDGLVFSLVETTERKKIQTMLEENACLLEEYASKMETLADERAKQLNQAERMAAIGETAGMVGHDIRNPLQAIAGELYLAKTELDNVPECTSKRCLHESVANIEENLYYIDKIVADLQDYTKPLKPNLEPVNVEKAIEDTLLIVKIPHNLQVSINVEENFPDFNADFAMLKRALINLIQNAVQAMPKGGDLKIHAQTEGGYACVSVEDTGEGISKEAQARLYTPLFTTKSKGQGFGLAVVKRLVESQNGTISYKTQKGKGTTFTIQLPLNQK